MRRAITQFKSMLLLTVAICFMQANANAVTYTAIASGNFSSTATWTGGIVPPALLSGDDIVIPPGIKVTLDQNQTLMATSSLTVNGTLTANTGYYVSMTSGTVAGIGTMVLDSVYANFNSGFTFTGAITANTIASANAKINTAANITVDKTLHLMAGTFEMASGSLTMSGNSTIVVSGGTMTITGGSANLSNNYNVMYTTQAATAGVELTGSGLVNITVDVPGNANVALSSDLDVSGTLTLTSGTLNLNNNNLTFTSTGDLSGTGTISSSSNSDITINATAGLTSAIKFSTGGNTVDDFTVNMSTNTSSVSVDGDLMISGQLNLQSGRVNIGSNNLDIMTNATVTGGSANSFVITGTGGQLSIDVAANSSQTFHIGTSNDYAPTIITANSGSASSKFSAGVNGAVMQNGTTGASIGATQPVVDATWHIASSASANVNVDIETSWSTNMEVNSFNRAKAYLSHYTSAAWDVNAAASATMTGSGMYSIKRTGITSFSPFAVFDENTKVSVNDIAANNNVKVYPNPATSTITISLNKYSNNASIDIYNTTGQVVYTSAMQSKTQSVDISNLASGMYYLSVSNDNTRGLQKFVKQ